MTFKNKSYQKSYYNRIKVGIFALLLGVGFYAPFGKAQSYGYNYWGLWLWYDDPRTFNLGPGIGGDYWTIKYVGITPELLFASFDPSNVVLMSTTSPSFYYRATGKMPDEVQKDGIVWVYGGEGQWGGINHQPHILGVLKPEEAGPFRGKVAASTERWQSPIYERDYGYCYFDWSWWSFGSFNIARQMSAGNITGPGGPADPAHYDAEFWNLDADVFIAEIMDGAFSRDRALVMDALNRSKIVILPGAAFHELAQQYGNPIRYITWNGLTFEYAPVGNGGIINGSLDDQLSWRFPWVIPAGQYWGPSMYRPVPNFVSLAQGYNRAAAEIERYYANKAPQADAGTDQNVIVFNACSTSVALDGTGSSDPDDDPLTYTWTGPFGTATGPNPTVTLSNGTHAITVTVDDGRGGTGTDTVTVTVEDKTAPTINILPQALTLSLGSNCQTVLPDLRGEVRVSDNCTAASALKITQNPASGTPIGIEITAVQISVEDESGNVARGIVNVEAKDTTPPIISHLPEPKTLSVGTNCQAIVPALTGEVAASDNCTSANELIISQSPSAGTAVGTGNTIVTISVQDHAGNIKTGQVEITAKDTTPPVITKVPAPISIFCQANCSTVIPNLIPLVSATDNCSTNLTISQTPAAGTIIGIGTVEVEIKMADASMNLASVTIPVTVINRAPTASAGGPYSVREGDSITLTATGSDPDGSSVSFAWDLNGDGVFETPGAAIPYHAIDGPASIAAYVKVTDGCGLSTVVPAAISILNALPVVGSISGPADPLLINVPVNLTATFTDPGISDTHSAVWNWGDGTTSAGGVTETGGNGSVTGTHAYTAAGVYPVTLTVTDRDGGIGQATFEYVVVYDPSAGFVTGGGWIDSASGAYIPNPVLSGKAMFGFVSKYQKGANVPTGETQFKFHVADMSFKSTFYQWLVIAGAKAQYKGEGTINGLGSYGFMLTAIDGTLKGGGGVDKFRIKIWDKVTGSIIYDNQLGDDDNSEPSTALSGGSIVIHKQ